MYCILGLTFSYRYGPGKASDELLQAWGLLSITTQYLVVGQVMNEQQLLLKGFQIIYLNNMGIIALTDQIKHIKFVANGTLIDILNPK